MPNATHIHQPEDNGIIHPLKCGYDKIVKKACQRNPEIFINYATFAELFEQTFDRFNNPINTITAFRVCGLFPFDQNALNISKVLGQQAKDQKDFLVETKTETVGKLEFVDCGKEYKMVNLEVNKNE